MPSPFPGMDPYIEDPEIWSDFHGDLAGEIRAALNAEIQPRYVARLTPRVTAEGLARETAQASVQAPVESAISLELPLKLYAVEILETGTMKLVTAIEILSPVNKRPGHEAFGAYRRKRRELFRTEAHLMEIDFLRGGERPPLDQPVPTAPYYVVLSRASRRPVVEVWPVQLRERLPVLPVPLLEPDADVALDLGAQVAAVYERGAYAPQIDYASAPPSPPLSEEDAGWIAQTLKEQGIRKE